MTVKQENREMVIELLKQSIRLLESKLDESAYDLIKSAKGELGDAINGVE